MNKNNFFHRPLAIAPDAAAELTAHIKSGGAFPQVKIGAATFFDMQNGDGLRGDGVQVISLRGIVLPRGGMFGDFATGCTAVAAQLRTALGDERVSRIVLDVDSPGGDVLGVPELAEEIYRARGRKPITAVANGMMASAAYWIGSAADEVVVTPSGMAGSIGVLAVHLDYSQQLEAEGIRPSIIYAGAHKTEGNPYEPLTDEARADIQADVDRYYKMFTTAVARHRGVTRAVVEREFGQGRTLGADEAVRVGMADRVGTIEDVINSTGRGRRRGKRAEVRQRRLRLAEMQAPSSD